MAKAVLHFQKNGAIKGGSLGPHIDREEGKEYSYRHADPKLKKDNIFLNISKYCKMPYNEAIKARIVEGYTGKKNLRKDAVWSINTILSGSAEQMQEIRNNKKLFAQWIEENRRFCEENFGKENITRFAVHLDEKTPHIHCVFVPITPDGRLSAKDFIGNGKKLENLQTQYAQRMQKFGLERGVKSDRKHHTTEEYRRRELHQFQSVKDLTEDLQNLKQTAIFSFSSKKAILNTKIQDFALKTHKSIESYKSALKNTEKGFKQSQTDLYRESKVSKQLKEENLELKNYLIKIKKKKEEDEEQQRLFFKKIAFEKDKAEDFFQAIRTEEKNKCLQTIEDRITQLEEPTSWLIDDIIRQEMKHLSSANPWETLRTHFGEETELKIFQFAQAYFEQKKAVEEQQKIQELQRKRGLRR